jgi:glycosyltransferase involved in cell wall biosynthesis
MSDKAQGRVSVIIPARNEEANIARVVRSVAGQEPVLEVLVVDDQSEDRTGLILEELQGEITRLRILRIEALPEGWSGKAYALNVAAREARGDWLLFTDADTEHLPGSLETLVGRAEQAGADLLSVSPGQLTLTWWEKSVIPLVFVHLATLYRFDEVSDPHSLAAAANGQYLLVRREAYERVGGHAAVRGEILEDVELARHIKSAGGRLIFLRGSAWVRTRMYRSFGEMWYGWTKNLHLIYRRDWRRMLATVAELWTFDLLPLLAFLSLAVLLAVQHSGFVTGLLAAACLLIAVVRHWSYRQALRRESFPGTLAGYLAPGSLLFGLLLLNSAAAHQWTGRVRWKGRAYSTKGKA